MKEYLEAIIQYSHFSLPPMQSNPSLALHTARFTLYSILCTACKDCCNNTFTAESMISVLQKITSLAESDASSDNKKAVKRTRDTDDYILPSSLGKFI